MNNDASRRLCALVIAVFAMSPVAAGAARGAELTVSASSDPHHQDTAAQQALFPIGPGEGAVSVMSRSELSQVTSDKAVAQRQGGGTNRIRMPAENSSADDARMRFDKASGFLIVDIRQSTGIANNQANSAQIHVP